jgi:hypothetical protein
MGCPAEPPSGAKCNALHIFYCFLSPYHAPNVAIFPILWTIAYNLHCTSTFDFVRSVNRFMCL